MDRRNYDVGTRPADVADGETTPLTVSEGAFHC